MNYTRLIFTIVLAVVFTVWSNAYVYAQDSYSSSPPASTAPSVESPTPKQTNNTGNASSSSVTTNAAPIVLKPLPGGTCPTGYHLVSGVVCIKDIKP